MPDGALFTRVDLLAAKESSHLIESRGDLRRILLGEVPGQVQTAAIEVEHGDSPGEAAILDCQSTPLAATRSVSGGGRAERSATRSVSGAGRAERKAASGASRLTSDLASPHLR